MKLEIRKLSVNDGMEFYEMLQEMPADENGLINSVAGKTYEEYKEWLKQSVRDSGQKEIIDGWKVPQTTFWLLEDGKPVGFGKVRHFLTEKLLEEGGNVGYLRKWHCLTVAELSGKQKNVTIFGLMCRGA